MSYLNALQKKVDKTVPANTDENPEHILKNPARNEALKALSPSSELTTEKYFTKETDASPDSEKMLALEKKWKTLSPKKKQELRDAFEKRLKEGDAKAKTKAAENEAIAAQKSTHEAKQRATAKAKEEQERTENIKELLKLQKQRKAEEKAVKLAEQKEQERKDKITVDTRGYRLHVLESEMEYNEAQRMIDDANKKIQRFGLDDAATMGVVDELEAAENTVQIIQHKRDTMLLELITAAAEKWGEEGRQKLIDQGIPMHEMDRVTK